jgi:hypothetical protein
VLWIWKGAMQIEIEVPGGEEFLAKKSSGASAGKDRLQKLNHQRKYSRIYNSSSTHPATQRWPESQQSNGAS